MARTPEQDATDPVRCSFCQKNLASCNHLIRSPRANICDECVELSMRMLVEAGVFSRLRLARLLF